MTIASTPTLLSLDRYAHIMGLNPVHFSTANVIGVTPTPFPARECSTPWFQYEWQSTGQVSREHLAIEIKAAEDEIAKVAGFYPAPTWIAEDEIPYPRPHRREYYGDGRDIRGDMKAVLARYGKIINLGRRAVELIASPNVAYSDEDGDGFDETATVTTATTYTDECQLKVYYNGQNANPAYEIRPARTKEIAGGVFTATFFTWQMISPDLWETFPTDAGGSVLIDIADVDNLEVNVDVYREYPDNTEPSVEFIWEAQPTVCPVCGGVGCDACGETTQDGCASIRKSHDGAITCVPASYNTDTGLWEKQSWTGCREPDRVKLWYYAGDRSQEYLSGYTCEPLSAAWARVIAYLVTARLEHELCACDNIRTLSQRLREDMSRTKPGEATFIFTTPEIVENPFGTRVGEIMAWRYLRKIVKRRKVSFAAV